ncbi:hypothetical protein WMY93_018103 [Mugilogobius chulae]|uniref:Molybdenum cofactor sulfurase n=1 Tax=Mugilogobius chulae TaxID=88201 RepID=A0AAW0NP40_9GOBI
MDFHKLCTFDFFSQVSGHYGYEGNFQDMVEKEFRRIKGVTYLDHAAATLYPESVIQNYSQDISTSLYGNPHSRSPSSRLTHDTVERVRYRILQHFSADPEQYSVIFTSGCTAALKLLAETFPWRSESVFSYLTDSHTSVVGMRALTSGLGATTLPVAPEDMENTSKNTTSNGDISCQTPHLFCFPAQSNFSGKKYPLSYVRGIQARSLNPASSYKGKWGTAGSHGRRSNVEKSYFGGGTAAAYLSGEDYYVPAESTSDRFEDGTVSFLDIIALNHSFDALYKLTGGMQWVQQHTFGLARFTYIILSSLRHGSGRPVAQIYPTSSLTVPTVDRMAALYNIHIRTGCFCNTGACQAFLGISNQQMKSNLQAGHVCGDDVDLVLGRPTGSVRVSFGFMSTFQDLDRERIDALTNSTSQRDASLQPITRENGATQEVKEAEEPREGAERSFGHEEEDGCSLTNIYIYPIKSCGAFEVQQWPLGPQGLLFDRSFMVVNVNGVCLSQKREARLCLIKPQILLKSNQLLLTASGMESICVPLETKTQSQVCQSKVCGDRVETLDCGDAVAQWLSDFLQQKCRLIRLSPDFTRDARKKKQPESSQGEASSSSGSSLSLVNEAQYLVINRASVEHIHRLIHNREELNADERLVLDVENVITRFRANLVVSAAEAFQEDNWSQLIIADTRFVVSGQCGRCHMIGIDQETGSKSKEPLMSLCALRSKGKVTFGVYLSHQLPQDSNVTTILKVGSRIQPKTLQT